MSTDLCTVSVFVCGRLCSHDPFTFLQFGGNAIYAPRPSWLPYAFAFVIGLLAAQAILPKSKGEDPAAHGAVYRFFHSATWGIVLGGALGLGLLTVGISFETWAFPTCIISCGVGGAIRYAIALTFERPGTQEPASRS